jgi:hypothetical protein
MNQISNKKSRVFIVSQARITLQSLAKASEWVKAKSARTGENKSLLLSLDKFTGTSEGILELFPNPAKELMTVSYSVDKAYESVELVVYNNLAQEVWTKKLRSGQDQIIVEHGLEPGHYVMSLIVDEEVYRATPLIIID